MIYKVTAIIDGDSTDVICNGTDEFIDVCEALGDSVKACACKDRGGIDWEYVEVDWL